jgi:hypothetical protein
VPTTRPRHLITETDRVAEALDDAAQHWPDDRGSRAKLIVHLVQKGHQALLREADERRNARLTAIRRSRGAFTGSYESDYLQRLREDWPA